MIPEGHTIEDIKKREQIIRDFYREWKEKNPSQRKYNLSLKEYINIRMSPVAASIPVLRAAASPRFVA